MGAAAGDDFALWATPFGGWSTVDGTGNSAKLDRDTGGFIAGGDLALGGGVRAGLLAG